VTQKYQYFTPSTDTEKDATRGSTQPYRVEVAYNAGVTDPVEDTVIKALQDLGITGVSAVKTAKRYLIDGQLDQQQLEAICSKLLVNP
ncbi:hypothetical protein C6A37_13025, partial [Desulfobacteraceae bacterium SEEP-SAG9]